MTFQAEVEESVECCKVSKDAWFGFYRNRLSHLEGVERECDRITQSKFTWEIEGKDRSLQSVRIKRKARLGLTLSNG